MCLAVPGKIIEIAGSDIELTARVDFGGVVKQVSLAFLPGADVGDYVIVHAGVAISRINEAEARRVIEFVEQAIAARNESDNEISR